MIIDCSSKTPPILKITNRKTVRCMLSLPILFVDCWIKPHGHHTKQRGIRVPLQTNQTLKVKPSIHGTVRIFICVHQGEIALKKNIQGQSTYRLCSDHFPLFSLKASSLPNLLCKFTIELKCENLPDTKGRTHNGTTRRWRIVSCVFAAMTRAPWRWLSML